MNEKEFDLSEYMAGGIENIVKTAIRSTLKDPKKASSWRAIRIPEKKMNLRKHPLSTKPQRKILR